MKTFSERQGFLSEILSEEVQTDLQSNMTKILRTLLWNVVVAKLFGKLSANSYGLITQDYHIFINLWRHFFKLPMDEFDKQLGERRDTFRDFFEVAEWNRIYDFFEFVAQKMTPFDAQEWIHEANQALAEGGSRYHFVGTQLVPVSESGSSAVGSSAVLSEALELFENQGLDSLKKNYELVLRTLRPFYESKDPAELNAFHQGFEKMLGELVAFLGTALGAEGLEGYSGVRSLRELLQEPALQFSAATRLFFAGLVEYLACSLDELKRSLESKQRSEGSAIFYSDLVYLLGQGALVANLVLERLFELKMVEKKPARQLQPAVQDPWGERRIGK